MNNVSTNKAIIYIRIHTSTHLYVITAVPKVNRTYFSENSRSAINVFQIRTVIFETKLIIYNNFQTGAIIKY
jgi:hypothetical protein